LQALCITPHGPVDLPKTPRELEERLTGRWLRCDGAQGSPWTALVVVALLYGLAFLTGRKHLAAAAAG